MPLLDHSYVELVDSAGNTRAYELIDGEWYPFCGEINSLTKNADGTWTETNPQGRTYSYDLTGNLHLQEEAEGGRATLAWDAENRLTQAQVPFDIVNTMTYRADGLRVEKQDSAGTSKFIWDGQNILFETDGNDATQAAYTLQPRAYGNLISQRRSGASSFFHFDALGSTDRLTDALEQITDSYCYAAYGKLLGIDGNTTNPFLWVGAIGYYEDAELEQYYIRARHYDPTLARWLSEDPIAFDGSGWNLYEYVGGNAPVLVDPSGLAPSPPTPLGYGYFCGLERRAACMGPAGARVPAPPPANPVAIDALDAACAVHDCCLADARDFFSEYCLKTKTCNAAFTAAVAAVNCNAIYTTDPVARYQCILMKRNATRVFCPATGIFGSLW